MLAIAFRSLFDLTFANDSRPSFACAPIGGDHATTQEGDAAKQRTPHRQVRLPIAKSQEETQGAQTQRVASRPRLRLEEAVDARLGVVALPLAHHGVHHLGRVHLRPAELVLTDRRTTRTKGQRGE